MAKRIAWAAGILLLLLALALVWLTLRTPELLRVGAAYSAKIVCSNVFIAGRDPDTVLANDVQAPGHPLLRLVRVSVDRNQGVVHAGVLGWIGNGVAVYRHGTGCANVPDGDVAQASSHQFEAVPAVRAPASAPAAARDPSAPWPQGDTPQLNPKLQAVLHDDALSGPGLRAALVIHNGQLVAQRYADGFGPQTPLLGWSMTKTVNAALVGMQVQAGHLRLDQAGFWPDKPESLGRQKISLAQLLAMSSGLRFDEEYGAVSDATRMLYLEPDMPHFVQDQPLANPPGSTWSYSSGTAVLLSHLWQQAAGADALRLPHTQLFAPLGMRSAVLEADARGTYVGSSYLYASAPDWARFAQFLLNDGTWNQQRLLPAGWVGMMRQPAAASKGQYGQGQVWLDWYREAFGGNADAGPTLPADTFWMRGHDGQYVALIPSLNLAVVRLGLTPSKNHYLPQLMVAQVVRALQP